MEQFSMNDYILHYGVKGMHWGVRKTPSFIKNHKRYKQERVLKEGGTIVPKGTVFNRISTLTEDALKNEGYEAFIRTYSELPIAAVYQRQFKKQGYNAIRDDNDVLYNTMDTIRPEKSLVVFEPNRSMRVIENKELTREEYEAARKNNHQRRKRIRVS